jgi:hypothetical protein
MTLGIRGRVRAAAALLAAAALFALGPRIPVLRDGGSVGSPPRASRTPILLMAGTSAF